MIKSTNNYPEFVIRGYDFRNNKSLQIFLLVFAISALIYAYYDLIYKRKRILENQKITIGIIREVTYSKSGNIPTFQYYVNNTSYYSSESSIIQGRHNFLTGAIGKRYFVMYDSINPSKACLLPLNPVPDSIQSFPQNGWPNLPTGENIFIRQ